MTGLWSLSARELPFRDTTFDFVYCSQVLECVKNPLAACREIMRVGKRGYIETPTLGKDTLFTWSARTSNVADVLYCLLT